MAEIKDTEVVTGLVRFSFVNVFERKSFDDKTDGKYQCHILIPKTDKLTIDKINRAIKIAAAKDPKLAKSYDSPLHDGDLQKPDDEAYSGQYYLNAKNSKFQPKVFDKNTMPINSPDDFYSGCYGRAALNFYAYSAVGKGVGVSLLTIQKLHDGEPLANTMANAHEYFNDGYEHDSMLD